MLLPYTALTYYGPACAAMVVVDPVGTAEIAARRLISPAMQVTGVGTAEMRPYRGRRAALDAGGVGTLQMRPARRMRAGLVVAVNELSQDDVSGAVRNTVIEGSLTLAETLRLILAATRGESTKSSLGGGNVQHIYKSHDGSKPRITATVNASGERTSVAVDAS